MGAELRGRGQRTEGRGQRAESRANAPGRGTPARPASSFWAVNPNSGTANLPRSPRPLLGLPLSVAYRELDASGRQCASEAVRHGAEVASRGNLAKDFSPDRLPSDALCRSSSPCVDPIGDVLHR